MRTATVSRRPGRSRRRSTGDRPARLRPGPEPPARRFNAGQKLIFWAVILGGGLLIVSGILLMFPFFLGLDILAMQWNLVAHAALGLIMIAVIIGHIYIGTVGMEGAFDAMWSGKVDYN